MLVHWLESSLIVRNLILFPQLFADLEKTPYRGLLKPWEVFYTKPKALCTVPFELLLDERENGISIFTSTEKRVAEEWEKSNGSWQCPASGQHFASKWLADGDNRENITRWWLAYSHHQGSRGPREEDLTTTCDGSCATRTKTTVELDLVREKKTLSLVKIIDNFWLINILTVLM